MGRRAGESGVASVFVLALTCLLVAVAWAAGSVVALLVAHREAQSAADLTALAAAQDVAAGGCGTVAAVATANKASLVSCSVDGTSVTVEVEIRVAGRGLVDARARAGPE